MKILITGGSGFLGAACEGADLVLLTAALISWGQHSAGALHGVNVQGRFAIRSPTGRPPAGSGP